MFNRKIASSFMRLYSLYSLCFIVSHWKNWCISTCPNPPSLLPNPPLGNPDGGGCAGNCGMVGGGGGLGKNPGVFYFPLNPGCFIGIPMSWLVNRDGSLCHGWLIGMDPYFMVYHYPNILE